MPFNGVSSKYISNYLAWFKFLKLSKKNKNSDRIKDMLINVVTKKTIVFELENLVCLYCGVDSSNCLSCLNRKRVIEILEKNNINTKEEVK